MWASITLNVWLFQINRLPPPAESVTIYKRCILLGIVLGLNEESINMEDVLLILVEENI